MNIKKNYIPLFIQEKVKKNKFEGCITGSCLFIDISGFTNMTEMLFTKGENGAEEMSKQLLQIFNDPIDIIHKYQGFVTSFAGDAFTAIFENDIEGRAFSAATEIIGFFKNNSVRKTPFGKLEFTCRCGISSGNINWRIIKIEKNILTYIFYGKTILRACELSLNLGKNKIKYDGEKKYLKYKETKNNIIDIDKNILELFTPNSILNLKTKGELRHIASVFVKISSEDIISQNMIIKYVFKEILKLGGTFNKIDYSDKGLVIVSFFGAPFAKEKPEELAIRLTNRIFHRNNSLSIGVDSGLAYTGLTGGYNRNEWTCIGDVVNTSARLMSYAKQHKIIVSERIKNRSEKIGNFKYIEKTLLKGKKYSEKIYNLSGLKISRTIDFKYPMVGRKVEFEKLKKFISSIYRNVNPGVCFIYGDAGIGKSRLVWELINIEKKNNSNLQVIYLPCEETNKSPWNPLIDWLNDLFFDENKKITVESIKKIIDKFNNIKLTKRVDYIASILGVENIENSIIEKRQKEGQIFAMKELIKEMSKNKPLIIFVDDLQRIDELTNEWLSYLTRNVVDYNFCVICTSRYNETGGKPRINLDSRVYTGEIILNPFKDNKTIDNMVFQITGDYPSNDMRDFLINKAQGNPFFLEQNIIFLKEKKFLENSPLEIKGKVERLPETLSDLLTARLDSMDIEVKDIVKKASVIGERFYIEILREIIPNEIKDELEFYLEKGEEDQVLVRELNYEDIYLFRHALLREAAYQLQLPSERKKLHNKILNISEKILVNEIESNITLFVDQSEKAEKWDKWEIYVWKYLKYLEKMFANTEILRITKKLLVYYKKNKNINKIIDATKLQIKILKRIGKFKKAEEKCLNIIKISKTINNKNLSAEIFNDLGSIYLYQNSLINAKNEFIKALELIDNSENKKLIALIYGNLGVLNIKLKNTERALEYYNKALKIAKNLKEIKTEIKLLYNIGSIYAQNKEIIKAENIFKKSLYLAKKHNFIEEKAGALINIGNLKALNKEYSFAKENFLKAYKIFKEIGNKNAESYCLSSISELYKEEKNYNEALKSIKEFEFICKEIGNIDGEKKAIEFYEKIKKEIHNNIKK